MAKAKRVYHWKHGWIPLDATATLPKPKTRGVPTDAERRALIERELKKTPAQIKAEERKSAAAMAKSKSTYAERSAKYRTVDTVDGVDFVTYKSASMDPMGDEHGKPFEAGFTAKEKKTIADTVNDIRSNFPGSEPVQIVGVRNREAFGVTTWDGRRISLSDWTVDPRGRAEALKNLGGGGAIAGSYADDRNAFIKAVVTHEMGHALQMQNRAARSKADRLAQERLTAADLGIKVPKDADPTLTVPRWTMDTLGKQSVYATGNQYEWFAEAFTDGYLHGDTATEEGKRALAILHEFYGEKAAA